jgi:phosphoglycerate dehydrogenase-like enzyme
VDHYVSGWNIEDIKEFTKPGRYNVRTFNKISPKVSESRNLFCVGINNGQMQRTLHLSIASPRTSKLLVLVNHSVADDMRPPRILKFTRTSRTDYAASFLFDILTMLRYSVKGLAQFPEDLYHVKPAEEAPNAHALLLRSHKLQEEEVEISVRAIARCGAGTNNIPVARMTELGIPVFNTPGANANAVKELILCGLLLGSRRVVDGINHMKELGAQGLAKERVEKDKALFGGREIAGKTLAIIGLGHIGAGTARDASALGMDICGYDPGLSIESALKLPREISLADSIASAVAGADYISINIPYIKGSQEEGGTHGMSTVRVLVCFVSPILNKMRSW